MHGREPEEARLLSVQESRHRTDSKHDGDQQQHEGPDHDPSRPPGSQRSHFAPLITPASLLDAGALNHLPTQGRCLRLAVRILPLGADCYGPPRGQARVSDLSSTAAPSLATAVPPEAKLSTSVRQTDWPAPVHRLRTSSTGGPGRVPRGVGARPRRSAAANAWRIGDSRRPRDRLPP